MTCEGDVLDARAAACLLKIGRNAVYEAVSRREIPHQRIGRTIRFSRSALLEWLASCQAQKG